MLYVLSYGPGLGFRMICVYWDWFEPAAGWQQFTLAVTATTTHWSISANVEFIRFSAELTLTSDLNKTLLCHFNVKKKLLSTWPRDEVGWEVNLMPKRCLASITHIYFLGQTKRETLAFVENGLVSFRCKPRQSSTRWGTIFLPNFWQEILTKSKV